MAVVALPDLKIFLNIPATDTAHDDELQRMLDRAAKILAQRVGPLTPVTVTDEVHTGPGPLLLKRYPVVSVTSATTSGVAVTDLDLDADAGVLHGVFNSVHRKTKVTYVAGRTALPADLEAAVLELTKHLWDSQRVSGTTRPGFQGYGGGSGDTEPPAGSGYLLPYRVQSLIEPYVLQSIA